MYNILSKIIKHLIVKWTWKIGLYFSTISSLEVKGEEICNDMASLMKNENTSCELSADWKGSEDGSLGAQQQRAWRDTRPGAVFGASYGASYGAS